MQSRSIIALHGIVIFIFDKSMFHKYQLNAPILIVIHFKQNRKTYSTHPKKVCINYQNNYEF